MHSTAVIGDGGEKEEEEEVACFVDLRVINVIELLRMHSIEHRSCSLEQCLSNSQFLPIGKVSTCKHCLELQAVQASMPIRVPPIDFKNF